jgi:hypothetical protein
VSCCPDCPILRESSPASGRRYCLQGLGPLPVAGAQPVAEVNRAVGFRQLYDWLDGRDILIVKADRREPLVVLPLPLAADIARAADQSAGAQAVAAAHGGK